MARTLCVQRASWDLDYEMHKGGTCQIYHLHLLKRWNEGTLVELASGVSGEDVLGPEVAIPVNPLALVPWGDHLTLAELDM